MSAAQKGKVYSDIAKQHMSEARKGMKFTDEHRANL